MLRIVNGRVHDPANGVEGEVRDICIADGKIVADVPPEARRLDASGLVVMPGGVDIHCHIAGPKVNLARKLQPEDHRHDVHPRTAFTRSGTGGTVPSTFTTGYRYATLEGEEGYLLSCEYRWPLFLMPISGDGRVIGIGLHAFADRGDAWFDGADPGDGHFSWGGGAHVNISAQQFRFEIARTEEGESVFQFEDSFNF